MTQAKDIDDILDPLLSTFNADLNYRLNGYVATAYISGFAQMTEYAGLVYEGPPIQQAIDYASEHCAKLVTQMDEETKKRLAKVTSDGIAEKRGVPGLARDVRKRDASRRFRRFRGFDPIATPLFRPLKGFPGILSRRSKNFREKEKSHA